MELAVGFEDDEGFDLVLRGGDVAALQGDGGGVFAEGGVVGLAAQGAGEGALGLVQAASRAVQVGELFAPGGAVVVAAFEKLQAANCGVGVAAIGGQPHQHAVGPGIHRPGGGVAGDPVAGPGGVGGCGGGFVTLTHDTLGDEF